MKAIVVTLLLILSAARAYCSFITAQDAGRVGSEFFSFLVKDDAEAVEIKPYRSAADTEVPEFYVVCFKPAGFVLVAAEDQSVPILGYSRQDVWFEGELPDHVKWWYDNYGRGIREIREHPEWPVDPAWEQIRQQDFRAFSGGRDVAPLCSTLWDQNYPYNAMCPADYSGPGGHVYAGCGATALAQVMKKWNHPQTGIGTHTDSWINYGILTVDFGATTYQWASMPNALYTENPAVATLLYHCGIAINMHYSPQGSESDMNDVPSALADHFGYSNEAQLLIASNFSANNWVTLLRNDLNLGRPIIYRGSGPSGGHIFVLDGYSGTDYFHFNWGWSGAGQDHNYYLNNLNPGDYNFTSGQCAILNIYPASGNPLAAPTDLSADVSGNHVTLHWQSPVSPPTGTWVWWHNDSYAMDWAFGFSYPTVFRAACRFTQQDLADFTGGTISKVSFVPHLGTATYTVKVWTGGTIYGPGSQAASQVVQNVNLNNWNIVQLNNPVAIPSNGDIYVGYEINAGTAGYAACCDYGPAWNYYGNMICVNNTWGSLLDLNPQLSYNWLIETYILSSRDTGEQILTPADARPDDLDGLPVLHSGIGPSGGVSRALTGFKVYRDGNLISTITNPTQVTYSDNYVANGYHIYGVSAVYTEGESPAAVLSVAVNTGAEDDQAAILHPGLQASYPNPFSHAAKIRYGLDRAGPVSIGVYDLKGRLVATLFSGEKTAGSHSLDWFGLDDRGKPVASGVYLCRMTSGRSVSSLKIMHIRQ